MKGQSAVLEAANCHFNAEQWKSVETKQGKDRCVCRDSCKCLCTRFTKPCCSIHFVVMLWPSHFSQTTSIITYKFHHECRLTGWISVATRAVKYKWFHASIKGKKYWLMADGGEQDYMSNVFGCPYLQLEIPAGESLSCVSCLGFWNGKFWGWKCTWLWTSSTWNREEEADKTLHSLLQGLDCICCPWEEPSSSQYLTCLLACQTTLMHFVSASLCL